MDEHSTNRPGRAIALLLTVASLVGTAGVHWQSARQWIPGQWPGNQGLFPVNPIWAGAALVSFAAAVSALSALKKRAWMVALIAVTVTPCIIPFGRLLGPGRRFAAELPSYAKAIRTGVRYGDQHEEIVDGRRLTYWRWAAWGLDNAIGVIYDPEDRLTCEENAADKLAFIKFAGGVIWKVDRREPHFFLVAHT